MGNDKMVRIFPVEMPSYSTATSCTQTLRKCMVDCVTLEDHERALAAERTQQKLRDENEALRAQIGRLKAALGDIYDKWENGTPCHETVDGVIDEDSSSIGNAFKLSFEQECEILNLIVDKAEDFEQTCANCAKPYRAHLLHDRNKCHPDRESVWFPTSVANAVNRAAGKISTQPDYNSDRPKRFCKVCGKPIWGEGWNPATGEPFYSHIHDNKEVHADGSKVEPAAGKVEGV